ncbi:predicted protein [Nematostella vectensis]|uniref:PRELI/MSF1 domain-containing protein n=1 Tax=Nematostella vectensis TaxID=45351 RepID=A7S3S1_NEMVE|nr:predicted protein [Nematostella vectensis]|eukprot:XP_001633752.1 predicted protein [Nematostella vectensis]
MPIVAIWVSSNITHVWYIDANSGEEYYLRRGKCVNVLPSIFRKIWPYDIEIEEEMWINHEKQYMRLHSYNVTGASLAKLEEFSIYAPSQYNRSWCVMFVY